MSEVNQNTAVISDDVSKKVASATNPALFLRLREMLTYMTAFNKYMKVIESRDKNSIGGDLLPMLIFGSITKRFGHGFTSKKLYVMTADECCTQNLEICTEVQKRGGSGFWEKKNQELCREIKSVDGKMGNKLIAMKEILREEEDYRY
ncbi:hypothetical protein Ddc_19896 [Ditylenchus destructor]|nr:hypothetical protein Ddc_19896 [Ditylenchus destructor]